MSVFFAARLFTALLAPVRGKKIRTISNRVARGEKSGGREESRGTDSGRVSERVLWIFRSVERFAAIYVLRAIKRTIRVRSVRQDVCVCVL